MIYTCTRELDKPTKDCIFYNNIQSEWRKNRILYMIYCGRIVTSPTDRYGSSCRIKNGMWSQEIAVQLRFDSWQLETKGEMVWQL